MFAISTTIAFLGFVFTSEAARLQNKNAAVAIDNWGKKNLTDPLDWECANFFGCRKEGCAKEKVWLDSPGQGCRYTMEYKLMPEHITRFFTSELARLEHKSKKFAKNGCLFGGFLANCYRRIRQIVRLSKYLRRAKETAKGLGTSHKAYALVTSNETQEALHRSSLNIAAGFKKHASTSKVGLDFEQGLTDMMNLQASAKNIVEQASSEDEETLKDVEKQSLEDTLAVEAMLKMKGITLSAEQRAALYAKIEAGSEVQGDSFDEELIAEEEKDLDDTFDAAKETSDKLFSDLNAQETGENSTEDSMSLIEMAAERQALSTQGVGPLKWIFKHGLGWLITRIGWLLLFLLGAAWGVIRAALFPILFIGCTAVKFLVWLFRDVGYNLMWEGNSQLVGNRFMQIGRCAPVMWDAVGFDATASNVVGQIVIQPSQFASKVTGVYHPYKSNKELCKDVQCGAFASCTGGHCYCNAGFYPLAEGATDCGLAVTTAGCACQSIWSTGDLITQTHYGCPAAKYKCKVDTTHPTFRTCKAKIQTKQRGFFTRLLFGKEAPLDRCKPPVFRAKVTPKNAEKID